MSFIGEDQIVAYLEKQEQGATVSIKTINEPFSNRNADGSWCLCIGFTVTRTGMLRGKISTTKRVALFNVYSANGVANEPAVQCTHNMIVDML